MKRDVGQTIYNDDALPVGSTSIVVATSLLVQVGTIFTVVLLSVMWLYGVHGEDNIEESYFFAMFGGFTGVFYMTLARTGNEKPDELDESLEASESSSTQTSEGLSSDGLPPKHSWITKGGDAVSKSIHDRKSGVTVGSHASSDQNSDGLSSDSTHHLGSAFRKLSTLYTLNTAPFWRRYPIFVIMFLLRMLIC